MPGPTLNASATTTTGQNFTSAASWGPFAVSNVVANDTILLFVLNTINANPTLTPTSVNDGAAYTLVATGTSAFNHNLSAWVLTGASSGTHNVTVTFASAVAGGVIWSAWSNPSGSFVDQGAGNFVSGTATFSQALTNTYAGDTVVSFIDTGGTAISTQTGTAWFNGGGIGTGDRGQYETASSSGLYTPNFVMTTSTFGAMVAVSLQNSLGAAALMGQACL